MIGHTDDRGGTQGRREQVAERFVDEERRRGTGVDGFVRGYFGAHGRLQR
jgi:hypothetical protein